MATGIPTRLTSREGRTFGFTVGLAFAGLAGIAAWRGHSVTWMVLTLVSGALLISGAVVPAKLGGVQRGWMAFAHLLSKVTTPVIMGIVYFLVITPIALVRRAIGRQPLKHRESDSSFWLPPSPGGRSNMERQF